MKPDNSKRNAEICKRYIAGESSPELGKVFGLDEKHIRTILAESDIPRRSLTAAQIIKRHRAHGHGIEITVLLLYRDGLSTYRVAKKLKLSQGMVGRILRERKQPRRTLSQAARIAA